MILHTPIETHGEDLKTVAEFTVGKRDRVPFVLTWYPSHEPPPREVHPENALRDTENFWSNWSKLDASLLMIPLVGFCRPTTSG